MADTIIADTITTTTCDCDHASRGLWSQATQTVLAEERLDLVEEKLGRLAEAQQRTEERLNILIGVVERYFSNGGRP